MNAAARSSASPPISPIITIASVSSSASKAARASMWVVPMIGSPPIPIADEKPKSRSSYIIWYVSVPDFDTSPTRPALVMSAGMMPAFDLPGLITPGQFGPMIRVLRPCACAQKVAVSWTATPSVITTASGISASIASMTESLVKAGGTKPTVTLAPVSAIASATLPNTGSEPVSKSTLVPALRALTPPTTSAPEASMRRVCFMPSEPVMPWTMILLFSSRKIATAPSLPCVCELGGLVGGLVHGLDQRHQRVCGLGEDAAPLGDVVAVEADDQRLVRL